jgi:TrmH family RNA methyltransferase
VAEALGYPGVVRELFVVAEEPGLEAICSTADPSVRITRASAHVMEAISSTATPQGIVAVANAPRGSLTELGPEASLVVVLADVRDPGNAGTLLRSAAAAGADAVVFCAGAVDALHPRTVRAAAGSLWRLPLIRNISAEVCARQLRSRGLAMVGADARAGASIYDVDLTHPSAIVLGNESWGMGGEVRLQLDEVVSIPLQGGVESLNVGVAGSLILFESARQRRFAEGG